MKPTDADGKPLLAAAGAGGPHVAVRCRAIETDDLDAVVRLLREGFPDRPESYWRTGLARMAARNLPDGVPRFGVRLDHAGETVGVLLTLYSVVEGADGPHLRCNMSSWYVQPRFRGLGVLLDGHAMRDKRVTYLNVSPAPQTLAMHEARGFRAYAGGQALVLPAFARGRPGQRVRPFTEDAAAAAGLSDAERALMRDHVAYGCLGLLCSAGGETQVVLLLPRRLKLRAEQATGGGLPCLQLIHGPAGAALAGWLGAIGRHVLLRHAMPWILLDADGPLPGVPGRYFPGRKLKHARGPNPVPVNHLAYTELAIFGA